MKRKYTKPMMENELFVANEYVAACDAIVTTTGPCLGADLQSAMTPEVIYYQGEDRVITRDDARATIKTKVSSVKLSNAPYFTDDGVNYYLYLCRGAKNGTSACNASTTATTIKTPGRYNESDHDLYIWSGDCTLVENSNNDYYILSIHGASTQTSNAS